MNIYNTSILYQYRSESTKNSSMRAEVGVATVRLVAVIKFVRSSTVFSHVFF